jgi:hypothetical protein
MASTYPSVEHRIRQAVFEFQFPDEKTAFRVRKQLENLFYEQIMPILEELFNQHAPNGQVYRIDRLEIDLGQMEPDHLDKALIRQMILTQLGRHLRQLTSSAVEKLPVKSSLQETLLKFLATGRWPWDAVVPDVEELEAAIRALEPVTAQAVLARITPLLQRRQIRLRLIYQFSFEFFRWLIYRLQPEMAETIWQIGRVVLEDLTTTEAKEVLLVVALTWPPGNRLSTAALEHRIREEVQQIGFLRLPEVPARPGYTVEPVPTDSDHLETAPPFESSTVEAASLYIRHAGIVLLHPFLARFFERLSLLDERKEFASDEARVRAIHLLYYLATGQEQPAEPETILFKVLLNFPLQAPLIKELELHEAEKEEATQLLLAVIQHWDKLRNTSPAALRETFLQREGKLTHTETGWRLAVEQRSVDILLDYLPWGLGLVVLPWLAAPLQIDWA